MTSRVRGRLAERDLLGLAAEICRLRGVTLDEICGRSRTPAVAAARQEIWWRLRHDPERFYSLSDIGRLFDRNHSTIANGIAAHARRLATTMPAIP